MPALGLKNLEYRAELALPYTRWDLLQNNYRRTVFHWSGSRTTLPPRVLISSQVPDIDPPIAHVLKSYFSTSQLYVSSKTVWSDSSP